MTTRWTMLFAVTTALVLAGCARDPSKNSPAADVNSASTVAPAPSAAPGDGTVVAAAPAAGETLAIDAAASKLNWAGSKVTATHPGGFKSFRGTIALVDGKPEASSVNVEIDMGSLWTNSPKLEGHLRSKDFFETDRFPKATFTSSAITPGGAEGATHTVKGDLTLHGVTKEITFPATITVGAKEVTAKAKFSINRKDFGIVYPGAPDDLIRDNVLIDWTIVAKRAG